MLNILSLLIAGGHRCTSYLNPPNTTKLFLADNWKEILVAFIPIYITSIFALRSNKRTEFNELTMENYSLLINQIKEKTSSDHSIDPHLIAHLLNPIAKMILEHRTKKYKEALQESGSYVQGRWVNDPKKQAAFICTAKNLAKSLKPR